MSSTRDLQTIAFMKKNMSDLKRRQFSLTAGAYFKEYIELIERGLMQADTDHPSFACRLLFHWSAFLIRMGKRMQIDMEPACAEVTKTIADILPRVPLAEKDTPFFWKACETLYHISLSFLEQVDKQVKTYPLLEKPSIYMALSREELKNQSKHKSRDVYFTLLREAVLATPSLLLPDADTAVCRLLFSSSIDETYFPPILANSPRYRKTQGANKLVEARKFIDAHSSEKKEA